MFGESNESNDRVNSLGFIVTNRIQLEYNDDLEYPEMKENKFKINVLKIIKNT